MTSSHVAVVGGGVAGLAAARILARAGVGVTVLEGSPVLGGKLRASEIAGVQVDEGAESMLARRPEGVELLAELGLGDRRVDPGTTSAAVLSHGRLHRMPAGQLMGVPTDLRALSRSGVLSRTGLARVPLDLVLSPTPRGSDVSVADYVGARLGRELVDRLVEPLLGGVYAGRIEELSFESTMPGLADAARSHRSLISAARAMRAAAPAAAGPMFTSLPGGMGELPAALAESITAAGGALRTGAMVRELRRAPEGWRLVVGSAHDPEELTADAVVVAVPAAPAARLLTADVPAAARELDRIDTASMAVVTLAYPVDAFPRLPRISGYLVPGVEGREVKAVTFSTIKWPQLADRAPGLIIVRCSIGRAGEEHLLQRSDDELKAAAVTELGGTCGLTGLPVASRVTRWGGALPQYTVGHADRVARIRAAVAGVPGLAVAGAAYDGVGIPACVSSARAAAARVLEALPATSGERSAQSGRSARSGEGVRDAR